MKIGISLPVHESPLVLLNQLFNIKKFIPNSIVCVHVSKNSDVDEQSIDFFCEVSGCIRNPIRLETRRGQGLMNVHVSNFDLLSKHGIDVFLMLSSNEMFIRSGLDLYIEKFDCGLQLSDKSNFPGWHLFNRNIEFLPSVSSFLTEIDADQIYGGQAEGQFFSASIFSIIRDMYVKHFGMACACFETEEIFPQTMIASNYFGDLRLGNPITLQNYSNDLELNISLIEKIRNQSGYFVGKLRPSTLPSVHLLSVSLESIFSIKRIDRVFNPLRMYITSLM